jgi:hypothetical protein
MANWGFLTKPRPGADVHRTRPPARGCATSRPAWHHRAQRLRHPRRAWYVIKQKDGRRNRYQIQAHLPRPEAASQEPAIGEVLAVLCR